MNDAAKKSVTTENRKRNKVQVSIGDGQKGWGEGNIEERSEVSDEAGGKVRK